MGHGPCRTGQYKNYKNMINLCNHYNDFNLSSG